MAGDARVVAVMANAKHAFSKQPQTSIELIEGIGVAGDAHAGATDQHLYHKRYDPRRPNLRQVHLIHAELFVLLGERGLDLAPGEIGENITTSGIDLLGLGEGTVLEIASARLRVTGLRNPCVQIDRFRPGLLRELIVDKRSKTFLSGIMAVVTVGGIVHPGDAIHATLPAGAYRKLTPV